MVPVEIALEEAFCGTKRTVQQGQSRFEVTIPPGVKTGSKVRAGDLVMTVSVQPHKDFEMDGNDLRTKVPVDLFAALLGGEVRVPTLQGAVALTVPPDTQNGKVFRLKGQGMPDLRDSKNRGDLLVEVAVELPVPLSVEARRLFETLQRESPEIDGSL
jgi:curved DNA-binding protein